MNTLVPFRGAGGVLGASAASQPTNTPDNLRSSDRVEIVLGLCQGPIKGLTNGDQSFYIGTTQYQNADGTFNFSLFNLDVYVGDTPAQPIIPVLGGFEDFHAINVPLTYDGGPITFQTYSVSPSQLIVRLDVLTLYTNGSDKQLAALPGVGNSYSTFLPSTLTINIRYQPLSGGAWINPFGGPVDIVGKTRTGEPHELRFIPTGTGPFLVEVTSLTLADGVNTFSTQNLDGFYEVTGGIFGLARSDTVGVLMATAVPVVRTTQFPNENQDGTIGIDCIALRLVVNTLYIQNDAGTFNGSVTFLIEHKATSSTTWIETFGSGGVTVTGKTTSSPAVVEYRWYVTPVADTYDVRVTIISGDMADLFVSVTWESMQEIVGGPMTFDGLACVHLLGQSSDQFSSLPSFWGEYDLLLCQIPTNYDPYGRTYTGTWDGTFKLDWTSNPAWCLYNMAMNATWGAVSYWPNFSLDKYDCYAAGVWCDQLVPDGQGGTQARYTFNGLIDTPRGLRDQLRYMAGVFNGTFLDDLNGNTRVVFDSNEDAVAIFTRENVIDGMFTYAYTDPSTRYNYITGTYFEPNLQYLAVPLVVQSATDIARYGVTPTEITLIGCTNAHEALRRLEYKLIAATTETEIVSFNTSRLGMMVRPYNVILVADPDMGNSVTGRIKSMDASRTSIYFRDPISLELGVVYTFRTYGTNPNYPTTSSDPLYVVEIPFVAPLTGPTMAIESSSPIPAEVSNDAPFSIGAAGSDIGVPKPYRITSIEIADGNQDNITVQAISINRNKLTLSDNVGSNSTFDATNFTSDIVPPTSLSINTDVTSVNGVDIANVAMTWIASIDPRVVSYNVRYRRVGDTDWTAGGSTTVTRAEIYNVPDGTYDFGLQGVSVGAKTSAWVYSFNVPAGLDVPPDNVGIVLLSILGSNLTIKWAPVQAQDLSFYWLRYSPLTDGTASWGTATDLVDQVVATQAVVPALPGTYFVKAVDTSGIASVTAASAITTSTALGLVTVSNVEQSTTWTGTKVSMAVSSGLLVMDTTSDNRTGSYAFDSIDLGDVYSCRLSLAIIASATTPGAEISDWAHLSDITSMSGVSDSDWSVTTDIAVSQDGSTYATYVPFSTGEITGRSFIFRVTVTANVPNVAPVLIKCASTISMLPRIVNNNSVLVPTEGLTVVFDPPFHATPSIVPSIQNGATGDYYTVTSPSTAGFTINCYDSTATAVSRFMDYVAAGYGVR